MKKLFSRTLLFCLLALTALPARMQAADPVTLVDLTVYSAVQYLNQQCTWLSDIEGGRTSRPWSMTYSYPMYLQLKDFNSNEYDEYLVTPNIELQPGHQYVLTLQPSMYSEDSGTKASIDVLFGQGTDPHTFTVLKELRGFGYETESSTDKTERINITVQEAGNYKISLHSLDAARIYNFKLMDYGSPTEPLAPTGLEVTPDPSGALKATVSFTMPTQNQGGNNLGDNLTYKIYRLVMGSGDSEPMLVQNDNATAGETVTWTDDSAPAGTVVYYVEAISGSEASERVNLSAYIGPEEPRAASDVTLTHNGTTATLTWTAPATGIHNIDLDPTQLTYDVTRVLGNAETVVATNLAATTFSENITSEALANLSYRVTVKYGIKTSTAAESNAIKLGKLHVPFADSFVDSEGNPALNACWNVDVISGTYKWEAKNLGNSPTCAPQDEDGGLVWYNSYYASSGHSSRLYTASIDINGITNGVLSFWFYKRSGSDSMKVQYSRDGGEWTDFEDGHISASLENGEGAGWRNYTFSLAEAVEGATDNIRLAFTSISAYSYAMAIDNVQVFNLEGKDLEAGEINVARDVISGNSTELSFIVANKGAENVSAADYTISLITDYPGEIILPETVDLPSLKSHTFSVTIPFTAMEVKDVEEYKFKVEVQYADDDNTENNSSSEATVIPRFLVYNDCPATTDLKFAVQPDKSVQLSWTPLVDPEHPLLEIRESFEDCADGATDNINGWIIIDKDNLATTEAQPAAPTTKLTVATVGDKPTDADGTKVLGVNYCGNSYGDEQNDWIISPVLEFAPGNKGELSFLLGAQYVDYYAYARYGYIVYWTDQEINPDDPTAGFDYSHRLASNLSINTSSSYSDFYGDKMVRINVNNIPSNARHIAIQLNNSEYGTDMAMWIDDISIKEVVAVNATGYNVYEEGVGRLNEEVIPVTTGTFTVPALPEETARSLADASGDNISEPGAPLIPVRRFFVTTVYPEGETTPTNTVETPSAIDLTLSDLTAPATVDAGEYFDITVTVTNNGNIAVRGHNVDYSVQLYRGLEAVRTDYQCPDLAPGESAVITFDREFFSVTSTNPQTYHAGIHLIGEKEDYNPADNTTPEVTVTMNPVTLEAPADLTATHNDEGLLLTWRAPFITLPGDAGLLLEGYNIYRNEQKIATEETPWPYNAWTQTETLPDGTYTYKVTAVYNTGESAPCEPLEITVSALDIALAGDITVAAAQSHITVTGAGNMEVRVFNPAGALLFSGDAETLRRHTFNPGSYIVAVAARTFKVQLR